MLPAEIAERDTAETTLPSACMVCGGDIELKVTARRSAVSYCKSCHWLGRPEVSVTFNGLRVFYKPGGLA